MKIISVIGVVAICGCSGIVVDTIPNSGATTEEVLTWVATTIEWRPDVVEGMSTPQETYERGYGDCEDQVYLAMYLLDRDANIDGLMVIGYPVDTSFGRSRHAWLRVGVVNYAVELGVQADYWWYSEITSYSLADLDRLYR